MYYLQVTVIATSTVLSALATLIVGARFQARRIKNLPLKADDWIILLALVRHSNKQGSGTLIITGYYYCRVYWMYLCHYIHWRGAGHHYLNA